jgi:hypothetical protein
MGGEGRSGGGIEAAAVTEAADVVEDMMAKMVKPEPREFPISNLQHPTSKISSKSQAPSSREAPTSRNRRKKLANRWKLVPHAA